MATILLGFALAPALEAAQPDWRISFPDPRVEVAGLPWFEEEKPALRRLPSRLEKSLRPPVWQLAQQTAGGRLRFRTDSRQIGISAQVADVSVMHHFTSVAQNGLDLYRDDEYIGSAWPDARGRIEVNWNAAADEKAHDYTVYLPLYKGITVEALRLNTGASLGRAAPHALPRPVVYYGSSITQGGCASNAGLTYQAILGRRLRLDHVNLGMSGQGLGEPELAHAMAEIDSAAIVLDFWANPGFDLYQSRLPGFVEILRARHPRTPILVVSPFWFSWESLGSGRAASEQEKKRQFIERFVAERRKAGDRNIHFVNGLELISREQADGLVDGVHPNSLGFWHCANGLEPHLRKALGLSSRKR